MQDYYSVLDMLIRAELDNKQTVAIYPFGKIGMQAEELLVRRYGASGIIIDNNVAKYNPKVINIEEFEKLDDPSITIILCASDVALSNELYNGLQKKNVKSHIKNILGVQLNPHPEKLENFKHIKSLCRVKKSVGYDLVRIGGNHDGGYVMIDDFVNCDIALSFGIGFDTSWDEDMAQRRLEVYCYDHTIEQLPIKDNRLHFNKIGISGVDSLEKGLLSLDSILYINHFQNKSNMILKMDVEGSEWGFFDTVDSEILKHFSQMTFELHGLTNSKNSRQIIAALRKVNETHQAVWIHANNASSAEQAGDIIIPDLIEITYASRERYRFMQTDYNCPLDIDQPNLKERFDLELKNWG